MKKAGKLHIGLCALMVLATACSAITEQPDDAPDNSATAAIGNDVEDHVRDDEMAYPIRVGDNGPRFPACSSVGQVSGAGQDTPLEVQAAPFERSAVTDTLTNGHKLFICSNSLDRKWFGIVYARDRQTPSDCGVTAPIRTAREYAGPCRSGWVSSAFVRLGAG